MPMFLRKRLLMLDEPGAGGGGAAPAPAPAAPAPSPAAPAPSPAAPSPAPAAPAPSPAAPAPAPAADWAEDWRTKLAGDKADKQLERMASPKDVYNSWKALQSKLSSGELKSTLPKDAKPEDVTKWRTENGIPEKHTDYKMPEGLVVGDAEKPLIDLFLQDMHGKNATPEMVQTAVTSYYKIQEQQVAAIAEADVSHKDEMENTLRAEWGAEYRGNVNAMVSFLGSAPGGIKDKILSARMADGRAIMNDPDVLRFFATTAREINPVATVVPAGGDQMGAINDEIGSLEKMMGNRSSEYWKGANADKNQARYRQLVEARDRKAK